MADREQRTWTITVHAETGEIADRAPGPHATYVEPLDGGHKGYQACCWDCDWRGAEHLRGDEEMGTDASRAHKMAAKHEAASHRADTRGSFIEVEVTPVSSGPPVGEPSELSELLRAIDALMVAWRADRGHPMCFSTRLEHVVHLAAKLRSSLALLEGERDG